VFLFFSYTKASVVASVIFVLDKKTDLISAPHSLVYFGIVIFLVYFKVSTGIFSQKRIMNLTRFVRFFFPVVIDFIRYSRSVCAV
jgi:hypothetical protein